MQNINSTFIANFKNAIGKFDLLFQLDRNHNADPNVNYNILSTSPENVKNEHIPKKLQRFNHRKHFIEAWMNNNLLALVNKKMIFIEIGNLQIMTLNMRQKINLKTSEKIAKENIKVAKREYYFKTFTVYKNNLKKTWKTIDETLKKTL